MADSISRRPNRRRRACRLSLGQVRRWIGLAVLTALVTAALTLAHVDAAALFSGLVVAGGLAIAGWAPGRGRDRSGPERRAPQGRTAGSGATADAPDADPDVSAIPRPIFLAAQGVLGAFIGTLADRQTLSSLGSAWLPVVVVGLGTLALSLAGGTILGLHKHVDTLTGALALVAGGASGLVALTRDLGGDERMVAVIQYLRVALVTATIPLVATLIFHTSASATAVATSTPGQQLWGVLVLVVCLGGGTVLGRTLHLPAAGLLGPMIVSTVAELTGLAGSAAIPTPLLALAYAVIGWQAGLGFTLPRLRAVGRVLPTALVLILGIGIGCAVLGVGLSAWTGESMFDCYLATTPGGIYAVLAAATAAGGNVTFVVAAQILRVLLMLFVAPFAARWAARHLK